MKRILCAAAVFGCLLGSWTNAQVNCLITTAEPHGDGWYFHDWFGWFHDEGQCWIYHTEHGLQYVCGDSPDSFYLYDQAIGTWFWSSCDYYPYLYKFGKNFGWFWYYCGCEPGGRWFKGLCCQGEVFEQAIDIPVRYMLVAPGTFQMGSPSSERGRQAYPNEIQHQVTLTRPFVISPTEITCWQYWQIYLTGESRGYTDLGTGYCNTETDPYGLAPVVAVSWYDAIKWLNLKSELEGKVPAYYSQPDLSAASIIRTGMPAVYVNWDCNGYRLPTSAEWEYACRAGTTTPFYTGDITYTASSPLDPNLDRAGWYFANSDSHYHTVALKEPNAWGLYDMHGNVWEWCWDWDGDYSSSPVTNPTGEASGEYRVVRSGGFVFAAAYCRSASRLMAPPDLRSGDLGFRPVATWAP